jgi:mRNA-degrading endonuclease YafQ of YafQ-DinJ toxin-antitoxin module
MPKKLEKTLREMPGSARRTLFHLVNDIQETGPVRPEYKNYSKLGKYLYHCHLAYNWVAVWRNENGSYVVEVEYVGSREKAPY